jgi:CDP-glycerol glycerophosphotransferase
LRKAFFLGLASFADRYQAYRPGIRDLLLRRRAWRVYSSLQAGKRLLRRVKSLPARIRSVDARGVVRKLKRLPGLAYYRWQMRYPLEDLAVYSSYRGRAYECNPAAIHAVAARLAPGVRSAWVVTRDQVWRLPAGVEPVVEGSFAYYRAMARARWLFNNANFEGEIVKRPGSVHVQTHHGTPLKHMGVDEPAFRVAPEKLLKRCDRWDFSLVSNRYSAQVWSRAYPGRFETLEYGYPRNDVLVNAAPEQVNELRCSYPEGLLVLYAPTHRLQGGSDPAAGGRGRGPGRPPVIPGATVLMKPHHLAEKGLGGPTIEELMLVSDVLVTDYSSVMFDYALLDRPIVIYAPDWEEYVRDRGVYFDLIESPPGVVVRTEAELVGAFESGAVWRTEALRAAFRKKFCEFDDGRAAERVVRRIILGEA